MEGDSCFPIYRCFIGISIRRTYSRLRSQSCFLFHSSLRLQVRQVSSIHHSADTGNSKIMSNSKEFAVILFLVIASFATGTHGSSPPVTAVTLWQFGQNRLLGGAVTVPLQPLGTASDGSATTYRYEVANNNVVASTDSAGSITIQTTAVPTSRTIVASASGWVEEFGNGVEIVCGFVDSEFGACLDTTVSGSGSTANSGVPTPVALQVALVASPTIVPQTTTPTQITSSRSSSLKVMLERKSGLTAPQLPRQTNNHYLLP
ncbi:hypothetical protein B0H17DRAFT_492518 [Mycena rosella]|uniref:Uncharacterized protein n=1 Tax=Mycena rosella TaxID=1033263 RepID=A0AAD7DLQ7_MYCRO|nr:hypothetical protein B0H17DRAFT_492518 [Mycena rosella]